MVEAPLNILEALPCLLGLSTLSAKSLAGESSYNHCSSGFPSHSVMLVNLELQNLMLIEKSGMVFDLVDAVISCETLIF